VPAVPVVYPTPLSSRSAVLNPSFEREGVWQVSDAGARSLRVRRTVSAARAGAHSLELSNSAAGEDDYVFQNLAVKPNTEYSVSAWVNARVFHLPAASGRGLLVWDAQDGLVYQPPLTSGTNGWRRLSVTFATRANATELQIRLYAPYGQILWDAVRLVARGAGGFPAVRVVPLSPAPSRSFGALVPTLVSQPLPGRRFVVGLWLEGLRPGRIGVLVYEFRPGATSHYVVKTAVPATPGWHHYTFSVRLKGSWLGGGMYVYRQTSPAAKTWFAVRGVTVRPGGPHGRGLARRRDRRRRRWSRVHRLPHRRSADLRTA